MLLIEIVGLPPYPFKWEGEGATFSDGNGNRIGVVIELIDVELPSRKVSLANISFGSLKPDQKNTKQNIDQRLTGAGDLRRVFSTVGEIVLQDKEVTSSDLLVLAGADEHAERRAKLYLIASLEFSKTRLPQFFRTERIKFESGTIAMVAQSVALTDDEVQYLTDNLKFDK